MEACTTPVKSSYACRQLTLKNGTVSGRTPRREYRAHDRSCIRSRSVDAEIIAIEIVDQGRNWIKAVRERLALAVEDLQRLDLRQRLRQAAKSAMNGGSFIPNRGVRTIADGLLGLQQTEIDRLEDFQRMFVGNVQRPHDLTVGRGVDGSPVQQGRIAEKNERQQNGRRHRPSDETVGSVLPFVHRVEVPEKSYRFRGFCARDDFGFAQADIHRRASMRLNNPAEHTRHPNNLRKTEAMRDQLFFNPSNVNSIAAMRSSGRKGFWTKALREGSDGESGV